MSFELAAPLHIFEEKELEVITPKIVPVSKAKCPQCGGELVFEGGCNTCKNCGWSKCD